MIVIMVIVLRQVNMMKIHDTSSKWGESCVRTRFM